jgi:glycosyltransferase involved in cell wall biosynthesis
MFGGGEIWMLRTLDGLQKRGHDVALLCRPGVTVADRAKELDIKVFTVRARGDLGPITILKTLGIIRKNKYQIILTNMDKELRFGGIAAKLAGKCVVIPRRGVDYPLKNKLQYRFSYNVLADSVIANSEATKQSLLKNASWLDPDKIKVIYNGINPSSYLSPTISDLRVQLKLSPDSKLVGFVGQLDERKGIHYLLPAFFGLLKVVPNAHLILAGQGPLEDWIKVFVRKYELENRVHLLGFVKDIEELMKSIDLFVLPSLWEGFGIVLIEAMAAGKPCVTTATSSMPEIVKDNETGFVVSTKNANELAESMERLLVDPQKAKKMGQKGRQRVIDEFTLDKMLDKLESHFSQTLKNKGIQVNDAVE